MATLVALRDSEFRGARRLMTRPEYIVHSRAREPGVFHRDAKPSPVARPWDSPNCVGVHNDLPFLAR
jgi:hypothetical protein